LHFRHADSPFAHSPAWCSVPSNRLSQIISGKRDITADTALRLARYFGTSPNFWMDLQTTYDLDLASQEVGETIKRIHPLKNHAAVHA
jgi:addiction module HigA family antidote